MENKSPRRQIKDLLHIKPRPATLNTYLLRKQEITPEGEKEIVELHDEMQAVFDQMRKTKSRKKLQAFAKEVESLEFKLQKAWNFDQDRNKHTWWNRVPHCVCQNFTQNRFYDKDCLVHGDLLK